MPGEHTLVLGGARSGKSHLAERMAGPYGDRVYLATGQALDEEMRARIEAHQSRRGEGWRTREVPTALVSALAEEDAAGRFLLVDCLTLWLSNLMMAKVDVGEAVSDLQAALPGLAADIVLVSNEVGLGLVPETPLGRRFRDEQGDLNRRMAEACGHVLFVAAGLPIALKGSIRP